MPEPVRGVTDLRPAYHARIYHEAIEDSRLTPADITTLVKIARFAGFNDGVAWPGLRKIAGIGAKQHPGTCCRSAKRLEGFGYLAISRKAGPQGQNLYALTSPSMASLARETLFAGGVQGVRVRRTAAVRVRRTKRETS